MTANTTDQLTEELLRQSKIVKKQKTIVYDKKKEDSLQQQVNKMRKMGTMQVGRVETEESPVQKGKRKSTLMGLGAEDMKNAMDERQDLSDFRVESTDKRKIVS